MATQIDVEAQYREALNSNGPVSVCGIEFDPSRILEELDPIAYRKGLADYEDDVGGTWECDECGDRHDTEAEADECCAEDE